MALTVIGNDPDCVGVPERTPADENERPVGSVPLLSENVTAPMVLPAVKVSLNAALTVPELLTGLVTVMVWQAMLIV